MIEMELFRIRIDDKKREQVIILREKDGERVLPIVIGINEADAIRLKVSGVELPRPLTHDLLRNTIAELGAELERIVIHDLRQGTFFAKLVLRTCDGQDREVDARPSDAIALALRAGAPILAEESLLDLSPVA
jgi:bifunctional DNase/RNase